MHRPHSAQVSNKVSARRSAQCDNHSDAALLARRWPARLFLRSVVRDASQRPSFAPACLKEQAHFKLERMRDDFMKVHRCSTDAAFMEVDCDRRRICRSISNSSSWSSTSSKAWSIRVHRAIATVLSSEADRMPAIDSSSCCAALLYSFFRKCAPPRVDQKRDDHYIHDRTGRALENRRFSGGCWFWRLRVV